MLHWVVQSNLHNERGYPQLLAAIERRGLPLTRVRALPFTSKLVSEDQVIPPGADVVTLPDAEVPDGSPIVAMGSYALARIAGERGWTPGAWLRHLDVQTCLHRWGGLMLNANAWTGPLGRAEVRGSMFVRPVHDSKTFTGQVFTPDEFTRWRERAMTLDGTGVIDAATEVVVAPVQSIYQEVRCFVVAGRVVTASIYRRGGQVLYSEVSDTAPVGFAEMCLLTWRPQPCFVLDVCETPHGWRIVETNCLNAAGFYAADVDRLVGAMSLAYG